MLLRRHESDCIQWTTVHIPSLHLDTSRPDCCSMPILRTGIEVFQYTSDPVAVLATIILLSFNSLAQNIISIFYYSTLHNPGNIRTRVWRYDGNVDYASGHHLTLIIVASVFLLLLLTPYTHTCRSRSTVLCTSFTEKKKFHLQKFFDD